MSNAEISLDSASKKPRFGMINVVGLIGLSGHQALHGASEATAGHMLNDRVLTEMGLAKAAVSVGLFAVGALYYKRHFLRSDIPVAAEPSQEDEPVLEAQPKRRVVIPRQVVVGKPVKFEA